MPTIPPKDVIDAAARTAQRVVASGVDHVKHGVRHGVKDVREGTLEVPPRGEYARSFVFAIMLPMNLLRAAWRDSTVRASMTHRMRVPVAGFLSFAVLLGLHLVHLLPAPLDRVVVELGGALGKVGDAAQSCVPNPNSIVRGESDDGKKPRRDGVVAGDPGALAEADGEDAEEVAGAIAEVTGGILEGASSFGIVTQPSREELKERVHKRVAGRLHTVSGTNDAGDSPFQMRVHWPRQSVAAASDDGEAAADSKQADGVGDLLSVIGALYALEWILIWIWREHHDVIAHDVSKHAEILADPPKDAPKLRFDLGFIFLKLRRAVRFFFFVLLLTAPAMIVASILAVVGEAFDAAPLFHTVTVRFVQLSGLLAMAYWGAVFGAANGFVAWDDVPPGWEPVFMRALSRASRISGLGLPSRVLRAIFRKATQSVWPACRAFEQAPVESAAMTAGKAICLVPGLYLVLRPFFGPAATHLILARRHGEPS